MYAKDTGVCSGFHDGRALHRLALLPVGVSVSLWAERQLAQELEVSQSENSLSLIGPPHPRSTIPVVSEPSFTMATSHDSTERVGIFMPHVCVHVCTCLYQYCVIHVVDDNLSLSTSLIM